MNGFFRRDQFIECGDGFLQRIRSTPMQQVAVEAIRLQPFQRTLASRDRAAPRCIARQHFRDQKNIVAPVSNGFGNHQLGVAIHLGGVDVGHAEIDAAAKRGDRSRAVSAIDVPGALPDHRYVGSVRPELIVFHGRLESSPPISATSTVPVTDSVM